MIIGGSGISPVDLAFWRDATTCLVVLIGLALLRPGLLRVQRAHLPWLAVMGAVGIGFFHVLWNWSVVLNGAALATVFQYLAPIVVTIAAWFAWREPLTWRKILAIALAITGVWLVAQPFGQSGMPVTATGLAVGLASALTSSVYVLLGKRLTGAVNPWTIMVYMFGFAALALAPLALFSGGTWTLTLPVLAAFAAFIFIPTVTGFGLYTTALQFLTASVASIIATSEVLFAAIMAYVVLGERLGPWQWAGALLVAGGVALVSLPNHRRITQAVPVEIISET